MSERLSRAERRTLLREDEPLLSLPVNLGGDPRRVEAHVRHLVRLFQSDRASSPCSDVIAHMSQVFDRSLPTTADPYIACKRGCAHCCSQRITVTAPEAFYIANHIRADKDMRARVIQADQQTRGMSHSQRVSARLMCPLLVDSACSIYALRPASCRGAFSFDVKACIAAYVTLSGTEIPMPVDNIKALNVMRIILGAAMTLANLPMTGFELNGAIAAALGENAEQRWLQGEDVFAGVDVDDSAPATFLGAIQQMAQHVAPSV